LAFFINIVFFQSKKRHGELLSPSAGKSCCMQG